MLAYRSVVFAGMLTQSIDVSLSCPQSTAVPEMAHALPEHAIACELVLLRQMMRCAMIGNIQGCPMAIWSAEVRTRVASSI